MANIQIIVGSMGGRALQCGEAAAAILRHQGHQVWVNGAPEPGELLRDPEELLLVCTSTTGQGELPPPLYPLYFALDDGALDLNGRHFGVIALGDSGYQHFAQGGLMLEDALYRAGARRLGEIFMMDARRVDNQPVAAARWALQWSEQLTAA